MYMAEQRALGASKEERSALYDAYRREHHPLAYYVELGDLNSVRAELANAADPNGLDWMDMPVITISRDTTILQALLDAGAEVDACGENGWTALVHAADGSSVDAIKLLLARGANPHHKTEEGYVPLDRVRRFGEWEEAVALLKAAMSSAL